MQVWYEAPKQEVAGLLKSEAERILNDDTARLEVLERNLRVYGGTRARTIKPWENPTHVNPTIALGGNIDKLRLNVVRAAIDTITSKVGKIRPRPTFLTDGGDWSTQRRAKDLQKFLDGAYHQSDLYELTLDTFRDAMILGTGVLHTYTHGRRIKSERVPCWELFVDRADGAYGTPRMLYRIKYVAESQVPVLYPKAPGALPDPDARSNDPSQMESHGQGYVKVVEAWCLPTCPQEEIGDYSKRASARDYGRDRACYNGRHVLLVGQVVVADEDWACPEFPFVFLHWSTPVQGFWGDSAVQEVVGIQVEINRLLQSVQASMKKLGQPYVFTHPEAVLKPKEMSNMNAMVIEVDGNIPLDQAVKVIAFSPASEQIIRHLWQLYEKAFEILGSNQLAASATAPAGLESGRALEQLAEEHSERFMTVSRKFEYVIGELQARQFIRCAKEIDARLKEQGHREGFVIRAPNGRTTIKLQWDKVEIDEDGYVLTQFPTSVLPTTPAARIQEVDRLAQSGWVDPSEARRLLNFPDLQADTDLATADDENLARQLELMLDEGEVVQPEPYQDLTKAIKKASQSILRAQTNGVPDDHIDLVRGFISMCEELLKRAQPAAPPVPAGVFGANTEAASAVNGQAPQGAAPQAGPPAP